MACGACMNLQFIILGTRMDPRNIAVGLEIAFCIGSLIASTSPVLAAKPAPIPLISFLFYGILGISVVSTIGKDAKK